MIEVLFFTQRGCAPCIQAKPFFEALITEFPAILFSEVDIREGDNIQLANKYEVIGTPDFVVIDEAGEFLERFNLTTISNGELAQSLRRLGPVIVDGGGPPVTNPKPEPEGNSIFMMLAVVFGIALLYNLDGND